MKKRIIALTLLCSSVATFGISKPASAQLSTEPLRWSIGPSVEFGNGTAFGVDSKFGISNNLSLRPFVYFPDRGTKFGTALTYDLPLANTANTLQLTPFVGGSVDFNTGNGNNNTTSFGLVGGADLDLTDSLRLKGAINVPLNNGQNRDTTFTIGAGFRF
jgi:hypothetical protein